MKNTVIQNIISNARLMDRHHFCDWLWKNRDILLEKEKQQIIEAAIHGANFDSSPFEDAVEYYNETFKQ